MAGLFTKYGATAKKRYETGWISRLGKAVLKNKLQHPLVFLGLLVTALLFAVVTAKLGFVFGLLGLIAIVSLPIVYAIVAYPKFGIIALLTGAYFIMFVIRFGISFPLGTLMDALEGLLILGFLVKMKEERNWAMFKNPISYMILIWIGYNMMEVINPIAASVSAWLYTIRSVALVMLTYFIFMFQVRDIDFIKLILKLWLAYAFIAALYAMKQEYIGFAGFEAASLQDPLTAQLYFIDGHWRKFSIFSDPVAFAYNMVTASMVCVGLIWGPTTKNQKIVLGCLIAFYLTTMLYSGTRGAYVLVPVVMILFAILNYNKQVLVFGIIGAVLFGLLIVMPSTNPNIVRFQTAFKPSDDASFNVRKMNQKKIQPYIQTHPIGGGLGATGIWGQRFAPNSYLANFPPDSGYVRVAVELGWVGLLIFCILMFTILKQGIVNFYRIKDRLLKSICLASLLVVFALNFGNYPQEAIVQFPSNIYFYLAIALINITYRMDVEKQAKTLAANAN